MQRQVLGRDLALFCGVRVWARALGRVAQVVVQVARSKWHLVQERLAEIEIWSRNGLSEAQMIKNIGVGKTSWEKYKKDHSELAEVLKKGREVQVTEVENSLFKLATGYYYYVDEAIKVKDPGGGEHVEVVRLKKHKPPETGAMCFFLKNKDSKNWADNPQMIDIKRKELGLRQKESEFKAW